MKSAKLILSTFAVSASLMLTACGFRPIYAVSQEDGNALSERITISTVIAPEEVHPLLVDALTNRIALGAGVSPDFELSVDVTERAERLAVQIDNTTTRYNYRLFAKYSLRTLETGSVVNGRAEAVTSYNIVSSQYSTLFAESSAREKAARLLVEELERSLIINFVETADDPQPENSEANLDDAPRINDDYQDAQNDEDAPFLIETR